MLKTQPNLFFCNSGLRVGWLTFTDGPHFCVNKMFQYGQIFFKQWYSSEKSMNVGHTKQNLTEVLN